MNVNKKIINPYTILLAVSIFAVGLKTIYAITWTTSILTPLVLAGMVYSSHQVSQGDPEAFTLALILHLILGYGVIHYLDTNIYELDLPESIKDKIINVVIDFEDITNKTLEATGLDGVVEKVFKAYTTVVTAGEYTYILVKYFVTAVALGLLGGLLLAPPLAGAYSTIAFIGFLGLAGSKIIEWVF